ncbi:MAG: EpsG family protein [Roseburia sp.]|nr:EpsG family protein [Roseburia sp.]
MTFYIGIAVFCAFLTFLSITNHKQKKIISALMIVTIVLFAGLRYNCWTDWNAYHSFFYGTSAARDFEYGFVIWNRLVRRFTDNYNVYLVLTYMVVSWFYYKTAKKSVPGYESLVLFVYFTAILSSGGMRQFIATGIVLFATKYLDEDRKKFFALCIIAFFFHRAAIISITIPGLLKLLKRVSSKQIIFFSTIGIVFYRLQLLNRIVRRLILLTRFFPSIYSRLILYLPSLKVTQLLSLGFVKRMLIMVMLLAICQYSHRYRRDERYKTTCDIYFIIYQIGFFLSLFVQGKFARMNGYFYCVEGIVETLIVLGFNDKRYRICAFFGVIILNLVIFMETLISSSYQELFIPYQHCF